MRKNQISVSRSVRQLDLALRRNRARLARAVDEAKLPQAITDANSVITQIDTLLQTTGGFAIRDYRGQHRVSR